MRDALLDDLDPRQRDAVTSAAAPLAIVAPAGSGKTRVLTRRIAYLAREGLAEPRHVLAVTFTRKAAGELVARIARLGVDGRITAGTFHAIALAQLRRHATERNREPPTVLERKARLLGPLVGGRGAAATVAVAEVAAEIEWAKARLIAPDRYEAAAAAARRPGSRSPARIAEIFARYEREKRRRHVVDFDDVLARCADLVANDAEFAAGQRWRFRHFFVDEFQDATPLQLALLRAWLGESCDLTVVGDPAQAIYGFTGADAAPLRDFERTFPGGTTIALECNYRSTPGVVALAEVALGGAAGPARVAPRAVRADGAAPTITAYDSDEAEARATAEACWNAHAAGVPWTAMAVLFRTNAQSAAFEAAFTRRNVPFRIGEGQRFAARPPVRALLERLRASERRAPGRGFGERLAELAGGDVDDDGRPVVDGDDVRAHLDVLLELGREYVEATAGEGAVGEFATWLDTATAGTANQGVGVDLVTFHRAKGLEWSTVFVTGLEQGLVPSAWATSPAEQSEERRLLHVALSRAEDTLHCSWARTRTSGTRRTVREPSPWLPLLEDTANRLPHGALQRRRAPRDHVAELRATLGAASPPAPPPERARRLRR